MGSITSMYELRVPVVFTGKVENMEIVETYGDSIRKIKEFLSRNQDPVLSRERKIDEIVLNRKDTTPIRLKSNILGSTYQSLFRLALDLKSVSHQIISIEIEENNIYGTIKILGTPTGKQISSSLDIDPDFHEKIILRPVYAFYRSPPPGQIPPFDINTFDIDFVDNNTQIHAIR